jgi:hypothetical protein
MKYLVLTMVFAAGMFAAHALEQKVAADSKPATANAPPPNKAIDMLGYLAVAEESAKHRLTHRVTEEDFIRMAAEDGTIVLDARSKEKFDLLHVKGAINLSFPDIDIESLKKTLPDKNARILIYCNNNFTDPDAPAGLGLAAAAFPSKAPRASLNISTYIALYSYGYRNVYELAPLIEPKSSKLTFESNAKPR